MPKFDIDVTEAGGVPEGSHVATVESIAFQIKTGESWNKEGTSEVTPEEWIHYADDDRKRFHITLSVPGKGNIWHDLYAKKTALGFMKDFLRAVGVPFDKSGFDITEAIGRQIGIKVSREDSDYGEQSRITKVYKP